MADWMLESSIGARIRAARRSRGYRSTRELAAAMPGSGLTEAILENIESGRKSDLAVSQLLNLARALDAPVSALLAPLPRSTAELDLPNLSDAFAGMSVTGFDAWISGTTHGAYRPRSAAERNDLAELTALRELSELEREVRRLERTVALRGESVGEQHPLSVTSVSQTEQLREEAERLRSFLRSSGWELPDAPKA